VYRAGEAILTCLKNGGQLLTCGNGGSAADALHLAEELVGRYKVERRPLPAICLNADVTALTCIANDYGYDRIFSRQIEAFGRPGDVLVAFSTSGNSANALAALACAEPMGLVTILLSGKDGGAAKGTCDHEIIVPSDTTARIQEIHTLILHQWLEQIDATDWPSDAARHGCP
jgi:D-sedoheptulose 7-phosphate isomerase